MKKLVLILALLVVVLGGTTFYFYKNSKLSQPNQSPAADQAETKALVEKVGRLIVLPEGEVPTVATITDPGALKNQAFFVDAKQGYKVLIFNVAKKAILYDPVANKIVNVAPLNIDGKKEVTPVTAPEPTSAPTTTPTPSPKP